MKLSPNEKRMLTILAFVAIIALSFQYLILPELIKGQKLSSENKGLNLAYNLLINRDGQATAVETRYEKENSKLEIYLNKDISNYLSDEDLDLYFTKMAISKGLKPSSLSIEHTKADSEKYQTIEQVYVTIGVEGNIKQLTALMQEIGSKGFLKVVYLNTSEIDQTYKHNLKIEIIMLKG